MDENEASLTQPSFLSGSDGATYGEGASSSGPGYRFQERTEGYDYEFVPPPDPKYECAICLLILREPRQTKCGHRFCRDCITKWLRESESRCPVDNEAIDERELFADNFARREILNFKVKCPNEKQGCDVLVVLRQLQDHTDQCPLALVPCPNCCNDILLRRDIPNHVQFNCPRRKMLCQNCQAEIVAEHMQHHLSECPMVLTGCQYCREVLPKGQITEHYEKNCTKYPTCCDLFPLGCNVTAPRDAIKEHYHSSTVEHQRLLCNSVVVILRRLGIQQIPATTFAPSSSGLTPTEMSTSLSAMGSLVSQFQNIQLSGSNISRIPDGQSAKQFSLDVAKPEGFDPQRFQRSLSDVPKHSTDTVEASRLSHTSKPSDAEELQGAMNMSSLGRQVPELRSLKTQNDFQDESLARHDQQLVELHAKNDSMDKANKELKHKIRHLENQINDFEGRACNGQYFWKIKNYGQLRREAEQGVNTALHSPSFYSSCYGYKLCVRANLNGVDGAKGNHLSIFIHFMQGEWDDILDWPFSGRIILSVIDQNPTCELRSHITETLIAKPNLAAFQKPMTPRNHKGFGYMEFVALSVLDNADYVRNDTLIIKAQVIPSV